MDIFIVELDSANNIVSELLKDFKHKNFSNEKKELQHCFSYLMVDRILQHVYNIENRTILFKNGKPYLESKAKFLSVSHSNGYVVLAFSDYNCGIDIERLKLRDYVSISQRMGFLCDNLNDFYKAWTKYEAEYKLGEQVKCFEHFVYNDYLIAAASSNIQETFELYIQNGDNFSNLKK